MGSDEGRSNEQPAHTVYLDAFYIDKIEVTNAQFAQFLNKRGNQEEGGATWLDITDKDCLITKSLGRYQPKRGYENHPVIEVTWYGARAYCEWRGRSVSEQVRLPTEAEWEKAAGWDPATGAKRVYPWGDEWDASLVNADWPITTPTELRPVITAEGKPHTAPVGSKPEGASPYGVLDMAGNAWEWMADWYAEDYYSRSPSQNPQGAGPGECTVLGPGVEDVDECKVLRGGSWRSTPSFVRTTVRDHIYPAFSYDVGFRCAKPSTATLVSEGDSASPEATPTATVTSVSDATTPLSGSSSGQIVFGSNPDGSWDIYIMNADGTGQQRLTTGVCKTWGATLSRLRKSIRRPSQASKPLLLARLDQANQR